METKTLSLVGKTVGLARPSSLHGLDDGSDVRPASVHVLAEYDDGLLLVEIAESRHQGRRFLVPRDRYDIELPHAEPVFARKERIPGGDVRVVMTAEPPTGSGSVLDTSALDTTKAAPSLARILSAAALPRPLTPLQKLYRVLQVSYLLLLGLETIFEWLSRRRHQRLYGTV